MGRTTDDDPGLPIKWNPCSNGEYVPPPPTPVVREATRRAHADAERFAGSLGWSRRRFLTSLCGAATTLLALEACSRESGGTAASTSSTGPGGTFALDETTTTDPDAAADALAGEDFVLDVQGHLLDYDLGPGGGEAFASFFPQAGCGEADPRDCYSIEHFLDEIFLRSDTNMVVLSAVPIFVEDSPLSPEVMEQTRRRVLTLCADQRVLMQGQAAPSIGDVAEQLAEMERLASTHDVSAWKVYTHAPASRGWYLDDHDADAVQVGEAFLRKAVELGVPRVAVHKGFSGGSRFASPVDIGPAAAAHTDVDFLVYHSGYEGGGAEGPYDPEGGGVDRLVRTLDDNGVAPGSNVYAELGSTWRSVMSDPDTAAHVLGKLLVAVGEDNVVWGTDSIWYGSPQDQIQAFRAFEITPEFQERYGYPALTKEVKAKVLGANAVRLLDVDPVLGRCEFTRDELQQVRAVHPAPFATHGPVTSAEVAAHTAHHGWW